jgi:hypothetical protein
MCESGSNGAVVTAAVRAAVTNQKYLYVEVERGSRAGKAYCLSAESILSSDALFKKLHTKIAYKGKMC